MDRQSVATWRANQGDGAAPGAKQDCQLVVCVRQRCVRLADVADCHRGTLSACLRAICRSRMEQSQYVRSSNDTGLVPPRDAWMGLEFHGCGRIDPHGTSVSLRCVQVSARTHLGSGRVSLVDDVGNGVYRAGASLRSGRILGIRYRGFDRQPSAIHWKLGCAYDARRPHHRRRDPVPFLCIPCVCNSGDVVGIRLPSCLDGPQTWNQRVADAWARCSPLDLFGRISHPHQSRWQTVCAGRRVERCLLFRCHHSCRRGLCVGFRTIWTRRPARSHNHSDRSEARLLFPLALCGTLLPSA